MIPSWLRQQGRILVVILTVLVLGGGLTWGLFELRSLSRAQRIQVYERLSNSGDRVMAPLVLADLIRDFPQDDAVEQYVLRQVQMAKQLEWNELEAAQASLKQQEGLHQNLGTLKKQIAQADLKRQTFEAQMYAFRENVGQFTQNLESKWVTQDNSEEEPKETPQEEPRESPVDFLWLLFQEKPRPAQADAVPLPLRLSDVLLAAAEQRWPQAKAAAYDILKTDPFHFHAAALWIYASVRETPELSGAPQRWGSILESLLKLAPADFFALYSSAVLYQNTGAYRLAEERFRRSLEVNPEAKFAQVRFIAVLIQVQNHEEARKRAWELWNQGPQDESTALLVWAALNPSPNPEKESFLASWKLALPASGLPDLYAGDLANLRGDAVEAAQRYQVSAAKRPTKAVLLKWGEASFTAGQFDQASRVFRQALQQINTQQEGGRREYRRTALSLVRSDFEAKNWPDTLADGMEALETVPDSAEIRLWVARAAQITGDANQALKILEPGAILADGRDLLDELLALYWNQKKYDSLRVWLAKAYPWPVDDRQTLLLRQWQQKIDELSRNNS